MADSHRRRTVVIAAVPNMQYSVYTSKLLEVLQAMGLAVAFWGWARCAGQQTHTECDMKTRVLLRGGGEVNRRLLLWYPLWMVRVFWAALTAGPRVDYICVGFDAAFPVAVASMFASCSFLFADIDAVSMSHRWPWVVRKLLQRLEAFVIRRCDIHVIPGTSRVNGRSDKTREIPNSPTKQTVLSATAMAHSRGYNRRNCLTLYVNGWLTSTRGMATLARALRACEPGQVKVIVAGTPKCAEAAQLLQMPGVEYLGQLREEEALAHYFRAHLVYTFYDPAIEINRLAEPNKWMDCLVTETPFITNTEVLTAEAYVRAGACFAVPYHDSEALALLFRTVSEDMTRWERVQRQLGSLIGPPPWDEKMRAVLADWRSSPRSR